MTKNVLLLVCVALLLFTDTCLTTSREGLGLTEVPDDIPVKTTAVWLRFNQITHLRTDDFLHLPQCTYLNLCCNRISEIDSGAFNGLVSLEVLYLDNNQITRLRTDHFHQLTQCRYLSLYGNRISEIESGAFNGLVSLEWLYMHYNHLTWLRSNLFTELRKLKRLNLNNNRITELRSGMFTGLISLEELWLNTNRFTTIDSSVLSDLPRPLELTVWSRDPLMQCDSRLCWLKKEEENGNITLRNNPECADGIEWDTWTCSVPVRDIILAVGGAVFLGIIVSCVCLKRLGIWWFVKGQKRIVDKGYLKQIATERPKSENIYVDIDEVELQAELPQGYLGIQESRNQGGSMQDQDYYDVGALELTDEYYQLREPEHQYEKLNPR